MTALTIAVVILHRRYKMLINAVLGIVAIPMTKAASLTSTIASSHRTKRDSFHRTQSGDDEQLNHYILVAPQTNEMTDDEIKIMFRVSWLLFAVYALLVSVLLALVIYLYKRSVARRSFIYLKFQHDDKTLYVKFSELPDATRYFAVKLSRRQLHLRIRNLKCFGILSINPGAWTIRNTLTDTPVTAPALCFISARIMRQLQALIATNEFTIEPILVHSHEYIYAAHRRSSRQPEGPVDTAQQPPTAPSYALAMSMLPPSY